MALVVVGLLAACARVQARPVDVSSRLFGDDDLPAGFSQAPLASQQPPSWCGGEAPALAGASDVAAELWTSQLDSGGTASVEQIVARFRPGAAAAFVAAERQDQARCGGGIDLTAADGMHLRGKGVAVDLSELGGGCAIEAIGGARLRGRADVVGGAASRIVVRHGDLVTVVLLTVADAPFDSGLRDRLAHVASGELDG